MATKNHYPKSRPRSPWRIFHHGRSYWFRTEEDADKKLAELMTGAPKSLLTGRDVDEYLHAKELLKGTSILSAVRYFLEHHPVESRAILVKDAAVLFHNHCDAQAPRPKTSVMRRSFLRPLLRACGERWVGDVTRGDIELILASVIGSPKKPRLHARNNTLRIIRQFFNWAKDSALVKVNPVDAHDGRRAIEFLKTKPGKGFLTIANTLVLLETCAREEPSILPAIVLQVFAGIRTEEVIRMEWSDVQFNRRVIVVREEVSKTGEERVIDWWPDALDVWLRKPVQTKKRKENDPDPVVSGLAKKKGRLLKSCQAVPGFSWGQNALRHTYATYGCAFHQSADRMKLLMGQRSEDVFFINYRKWADQEDARAFFTGIACILSAKNA